MINGKQIALVTGATSGIGRAVAQKFASMGIALILTGRRAERLDSLKAELAHTYPDLPVLTLCFDVRSLAQVQQYLGQLPAEWENIDILVNNAGLAAGLEPIQQGNTDDWDRMIDTNVKGLLYVTRTVSPTMVRNKSGHIFNLGSIAGKEVYPNGNVYCATKSAVNALSQAMRIDMLPYNVKVTQVCPGAVNTEFSLVRFHGDQARADKVYDGLEPLYATDIAECIAAALTLPPNVCINDMVVMPTAQASGTQFHRR